MIATRPHDSWDALRFIEDFLKSIWTTVSMSVPFLVLITSLNIIIEETDLLAFPRRTKKMALTTFLTTDLASVRLVLMHDFTIACLDGIACHPSGNPILRWFTIAYIAFATHHLHPSTTECEYSPIQCRWPYYPYRQGRSKTEWLLYRFPLYRPMRNNSCHFNYMDRLRETYQSLLVGGPWLLYVFCLVPDIHRIA